MNDVSASRAKSFLTVARDCLGVASDIFSLVGIPIAIYLFSKQSLTTNAGRDQLFSLWVYGPAIFGLIFSIFAVAYYFHCKRTKSTYAVGTNILLFTPVVLFSIAVITIFTYDWPSS